MAVLFVAKYYVKSTRFQSQIEDAPASLSETYQGQQIRCSGNGRWVTAGSHLFGKPSEYSTFFTFSLTHI